MKPAFVCAIAGLLMLASGCASPDAAGEPREPGPKGTVAHWIEVDSSEPGARIEANQEYIGKTPLRLKVFANRNGTFRSFGNKYYTITCYPVRVGIPQSKVFGTGKWYSSRDMVPKRVFFDFGPPEGAEPSSGR